MRKQLFETKVKDGIWLIGVLAVLIGTSLSLDDMQDAFRRGKIRCTVYVPSYEVPSDGPVLRDGDSVKLYKQVVGRVLDVKFFVAVVAKPVDTDASEPAPAPAGSPAPSPAPSPAAPAAPPSRPDIVSGLKLSVELYKGDFAHVLALVTPESTVRIEAQTLGDSSVLLLTSPGGTPVKDGDRINFPRNHASLVNPADPETRWGRELVTEAEIMEIRKKIAPKAPIAEPKKDPKDDF
jgi:hypothetical protein